MAKIVIEGGQAEEFKRCDDMGIGEIGIIVRCPNHSGALGMVAVGGPRLHDAKTIIFPQALQWSSDAAGYCYRSLLPGERIVITAD